VGIETVPTRLEPAYSAGKTAHVPNGRIVRVRKRIRRKICYDVVYLSFERAGAMTRSASGRRIGIRSVPGRCCWTIFEEG
jgi:hypothetical protein